jgi:hypothetical protein
MPVRHCSLYLYSYNGKEYKRSVLVAGGMEKQADSLDSVEEESTLPYDSVPIRYDPTGTYNQGVTKRCRLSLMTNSALIIRVQMRG